MKHDISYYRKIHGTYGVDTAKEAHIRSIKQNVMGSFQNTINWEQVFVNHSLEEQELEIVPTIDIYTKKFKTKPNELIRLGDLVEWRDSVWIVNTLDADNQINYQGTIVQCNLCLRWQLEDGTIHEEFGWDKDASKYSYGEDRGVYMDTAQFTMKVIVQLNDQTLSIRRNKRFLIGPYGAGLNPLAVEVSRINGVTNTYKYKEGTDQFETGLLEFTLHETQFYPERDNAELGIADYVVIENDNSVPEPAPENTSPPKSVVSEGGEWF